MISYRRRSSDDIFLATSPLAFDSCSHFTTLPNFHQVWPIASNSSSCWQASGRKELVILDTADRDASPSLDPISTIRLKIPCLRAFLREMVLPLSVRGPVERLALARFALSCFSEMGRFVLTEDPFQIASTSYFGHRAVVQIPRRPLTGDLVGWQGSSESGSSILLSVSNH